MIKRILSLRYVCKKYNLKYKVKLFGQVGWIDTDNMRFCVSLFQSRFYDVLYHEIGHLIADRSLKFPEKHEKALVQARLKFGLDHDVFTRLQEEATASKFALRVLKSRDGEYLRSCWHTYTATVGAAVNSDELESYVTTVVKYNKYFEGNTKC